jgi:hypothetical protein
MFAVCLAGAYLVLLLAARESLWFNLLVLVVFGAAAGYIIMVFSRARSRAFAAGDGGIWLGTLSSGLTSQSAAGVAGSPAPILAATPGPLQPHQPPRGSHPGPRNAALADFHAPRPSHRDEKAFHLLWLNKSA